MDITTKPLSYLIKTSAGIVLLMFALTSGVAFAQGASNDGAMSRVIRVDQHTNRNINSEIEYFIDSTNQLAIDDVRRSQQVWSQIDKSNIAFDLPTSTGWIRMNLFYEGQDAVNYHLQFAPVFLEEITAYSANDGLVIDQAGSMVTPRERLTAYPVLNLPVKPGHNSYYISVRSRSNGLSLQLFSSDQFEARKRIDDLFLGFFLGALIALVLYHIFIQSSYREARFGRYIVFLLSIILFTISYTSYHHLILPEKIRSFSSGFWASAIASPIGLICMYLFSMELLDVRTNFPRIHRLLHILPIINIVTLMAIFGSESAYALIGVRGSVVLHTIILPLLSLHVWRKNRKDYASLLYAISWVPFAIGSVSIVLSLLGVIDQKPIYCWGVPLGAFLQSIFLSIAVGHRIEILHRSRSQEQQAKLDVMGQLEENFARLKKRDQVIQSFVSPTILTEIERGDDPTKFVSRMMNKCITFVDMRDYTKFSEQNSSVQSFELINEYISEINSSIFTRGGEVNKLIGDAVMGIFSDPVDCLRATMDMRLRISELNRQRINANKAPIRFGTGISYGAVLVGNFGSIHKLDRTVVGDIVNTASRIESITRAFMVDVLCSEEFFAVNPGYEFFRPAGYVLLKGKAKKVLVYEIFEHNRSDIIDWKMTTRARLYEVIEMELEGRYQESLAAIRDLIKRAPPHSYIRGEIIDPTLKVVVSAIEEKVATLKREGKLAA